MASAVADLAGAARREGAAAGWEQKAVAAADSWRRRPAPPGGLGRAGRAAPSGRGRRLGAGPAASGLGERGVEPPEGMRREPLA